MRERERKREIEREIRFVVFLLVSCCFTFVICYFYSRNLWGGGEILGNFLGVGLIKFFNRSLITLKFEAGKFRERKTRKR